ncbi:MAG: PEPxxWA-CTERM sorting domain-containing protein [Sphingomonadaceae bacterium]
MNTHSIWVATALLAVTAPAQAAQFDFSFATDSLLFGGPVSGSGVFTTTDTPLTVGGRTAFAITSITGMVNGSAIDAPLGGSYGNYFTSGPAYLDGSGVNFFTVARNDVRFFFQDSVSRYRVNTFSPGSSSFVAAQSSPAVAAVPEPATWAMMVFGFGLAGYALRSRRRRAQIAFG